jgi:hypothetical protein
VNKTKPVEISMKVASYCYSFKIPILKITVSNSGFIKPKFFFLVEAEGLQVLGQP